jgi:hypothetical protein
MGALPGASLPDPALATLTERVQALFLHHGQSLAHPETAAVYRTSLEAIRLILDGALATGMLTQEQFATLRGMVDAADQVPDQL